jgi:O-antigen biosynthesis protein
MSNKNLKSSDDNLKRELHYDLYGRYAVLREIIEKNRANVEKFRVLDVGGQGNLMQKFLPSDDVFYLDPFVNSRDENFIKGDGCAIPLKDESFDWVVSTDVLEHIPKEKREDFLNENFRVAKLGVLLAAPFDSKEVRQAEINANENYKILSGGEDYSWLKEHIENGLPSEKQVEDFAKNKNVEFSQYSNGQLFLWEILLGMDFIIWRNLNVKIKEKFLDFNFFCNTEVFPYDSSDPAYRRIYFFKKSEKLKDLSNIRKKINDSLFLLTIKKAYDLIYEIDIHNKEIIREKDQIIQHRKKDIRQKEQDIKQKEREVKARDQEIDFMKSSKFWKMREKYIKLKNKLNMK